MLDCGVKESQKILVVYDLALSGRHWFQQTHWRGGVTTWSVIARPKYTKSQNFWTKPGRPPYGYYGGWDVLGFLLELERVYPVHCPSTTAPIDDAVLLCYRHFGRRRIGTPTRGLARDHWTIGGLWS